jgi:hypothetical protein
LFDVQADPGCTIDLSGRHPDVVADLVRRLRVWIDADSAILARSQTPSLDAAPQHGLEPERA